ncbi:MAG: DNA repair exonuclease [Clostridia bacterium]|nr:DNA repair exonuclease [Clostridia bacterium]
MILKFLHCADLHLDKHFGCSGFTEEQKSLRRQELKQCFKRIIELAALEEVDLLIISGDLYEHEYVRRATIEFICSSFKEIPQIRVFIAPGNHDPFIANSFYNYHKWPDNVTIMTGDIPYILLEDIDTCVYGVGFRNFYEGRSLVSKLVPASCEHINLLVVHGTVDMEFGNFAYNPMKSSELNELGMDYIALGHFHNRIDNLGGYGNIYNPGSPEAMGFDEPGEHGVFIGEITKRKGSGKALDLRFHKTGIRSYVSTDVKLDGCCSEQEVFERIQNAASMTDASNVVLEIKLKGHVDPVLKPDINKLRKCLGKAFFSVRVIDELIPDYNIGEIMKEYGLKGLFTRKVFEALGQSRDEYEKRLLMKALYYGLEALDEGRISINED